MQNDKRLIDANALMKNIGKIPQLRGITYGRMKKAVEETPTIDAVPVVRKPVKGYEGYYEVDQFGRVYGCERHIPVDDNGRLYVKPVFGKQMKQALHTKGYKIVSLTRDGRTKTAFVHRLVAEAFLPNPDALPYVNHKDEDKTNNFLDNLEWCTAQYNSTYGNARKKQAKKIKGVSLGEEHKRKISESLKAYHMGAKMDGGADK